MKKIFILPALCVLFFLITTPLFSEEKALPEPPRLLVVENNGFYWGAWSWNAFQFTDGISASPREVRTLTSSVPENQKLLRSIRNSEIASTVISLLVWGSP